MLLIQFHSFPTQVLRFFFIFLALYTRIFMRKAFLRVGGPRFVPRSTIFARWPRRNPGFIEFTSAG